MKILRFALPFLALLAVPALAQTTTTNTINQQVCTHEPDVNCWPLTTSSPSVMVGRSEGPSYSYLIYSNGSETLDCPSPSETPITGGATLTCSGTDPGTGLAYSIVETVLYHGYHTRVGTKYQVDGGSVSFTE